MTTGGGSCDEIVVGRADSVSTITINRPRRMNALTYDTMLQLGDVIETEAIRDDVRALVLTGTGDCFSSGADLASASNANGYEPEEGVRAANRIVSAILGAGIPVVARVAGPAVGVGMPIALAADLVIASENAYFMLAFTKIGLMPDGGASLLVTASIGRARALSLALRAERLPARAAADMGLIDRTVPGEQLDDAVRQAVDHFVSGPRKAFALTKRAINSAALDLLSAAMDREVDGQSHLLRSRDFLEGASAMLQKRSPTFTD
ncbi:enoyl-CoA hydratase [Mycobacterium sp. smrl_JER01]|uniref:enoyl-CoA hydratase n=1 Tax=Mycobacterium sp. smrl_JER01 TaxID=3402633 RepID=UPI003AC62800